MEALSLYWLKELLNWVQCIIISFRLAEAAGAKQVSLIKEWNKMVFAITPHVI